MTTMNAEQLNFFNTSKTVNVRKVIYIKDESGSPVQWQQEDMARELVKGVTCSVWYLRNTVSNDLLYPNKIVAEILGLSPSYIIKLLDNVKNYFSKEAIAITHAAVPVSSYASITNRVKQTLWTKKGIAWLLKVVKPKKKYDTDFYSIFLLEDVQEAVPQENYKVLNKAGKQVGSVQLVSDTRVNNPDPVKEVESILSDVDNNIAILKKKLLAAVEECEILKQQLQQKQVAVQSWQSDTPASLQFYINKIGIWDDVFNLTKAGLLNSDQVFSLFSTSWLDETGRPVTHPRFNKILRYAFHTAHSTHEAPTLKYSAIRSNFSVVCHVVCPKWDKPKASKGVFVDVSNPAYKTSALKHVRPQVRYSFKGIEWLRKNWTSMLLAVKA